MSASRTASYKESENGLIVQHKDLYSDGAVSLSFNNFNVNACKV